MYSYVCVCVDVVYSHEEVTWVSCSREFVDTLGDNNVTLHASRLCKYTYVCMFVHMYV